jgi:glycosyltransferase involved in cell wall biosynthesis
MSLRLRQVPTERLQSLLESTTRQRRVVTVSPYSPTAVGYGGIARSTGAYLSALGKTGAQIEFICSDASLDGGVDAAHVVTRYHLRAAHIYHSPMMRKWGFGPGFLPKLRLLRRADVVFIHATRNFPSVLAALYCYLFQIPYIVVAHATLDRERVRRTAAKRALLFALLEPFVGLSLRGAAALIVSGKLERSGLLLTTANLPILEIENFFDFDLDQLPATAEAHRKIYIFVGRVESDKGILSFLKVWRQVAQEDSLFWLAGGGSGPYFNEVMAEVAIDDRIEYFGELASSALRLRLQAASVVVLPTGMDDQVTENFGNVVVEGFIEGKPCMVTKGLHWDEYQSRGAVLTFLPTAAGAAKAVKLFEEMTQLEYKRRAEDAWALSAHFHVDRAAERIGDFLRAVVYSSEQRG